MASDFKSYDLIAIHAGSVCGLRMPSLEEASYLPAEERGKLVATVADCPEARDLRDKWRLEFDARLRDDGYSLDDLTEWYATAYTRIARSSIARVRDQARAERLKFSRAADVARAYNELAKGDGSDSVKAALSLAGSVAFRLLMEIDETFSDAENRPGIDKISKLFSALSTLNKQLAETELLRVKLADVQKSLKTGVEHATAGGSKPITREEVFAMLDEAMKGGA